MRYGFTLIELLVVITIIVVLLALLTPALDRAIYQAELAVCSAQQHAIAAGALNYAMGAKRYYPHRAMLIDHPANAPGDIGNPGMGGRDNDLRMLSSFMSVNKMLNDPFLPYVEWEHQEGQGESLDQDPVIDEVKLTGDYLMWFSWRWREWSSGSFQGMYKVGNRFSWAIDDGSGRTKTFRFDLLASDTDVIAPTYDPPTAFNSHPDDDGVMSEEFSQDGSLGGPTELVVPSTYSRFIVRERFTRGSVDTNLAHADGSVERLLGVEHDESNQFTGASGRMVSASYEVTEGSSNYPSVFLQLPRN